MKVILYLHFSVSKTIDDELTISDLTDAVSFNLTITRPQDNAGYECRFWNSTSSEWSSDGLTSVQIEADVVTCESYHLSTFTVVVVEPLTTVAPTTQQGSSSQGKISMLYMKNWLVMVL